MDRKEAVAIIYYVTHFRPYLYVRKFTLLTDHKPLVWFQNSKDPCSRVSRWRLKLAEFDKKQENSKNEVKPLKRRNLNPVIVPGDVDDFSEILEVQLLNIDSKILEFFQEFLYLASRLIFIKIFLLSPIFAEKYEHLSWKTVTTRAQEINQQGKVKHLNQDENLNLLGKKHEAGQEKIY